jgi:Mor family transcriptional regulator
VTNSHHKRQTEKFSVDFFIKVENKSKFKKYTGIQIKSVNQEIPYPQIIKEKDLQRKAHEKFTKEFGGKVFYVFSSKVKDRKEIRNKEVINEIRREIIRLKK